LRIGRSIKNGGFFGLGDQAAAEAICALRPKLAFSSSSKERIESGVGPPRSRPACGVIFEIMQHGLKA
jgi:hypothetical protein